MIAERRPVSAPAPRSTRAELVEIAEFAPSRHAGVFAAIAPPPEEPPPGDRTWFPRQATTMVVVPPPPPPPPRPRPPRVVSTLLLALLALVLPSSGPVCWYVAHLELGALDDGDAAGPGRRWLVFARAWGVLMSLCSVGLLVGLALGYLP